MLAKGPREHSYTTDVAVDGRTAIARAAATDYDAIVLDVLFPDTHRIRVCRELREGGTDTPIVMLTARDAVQTRVAGLDSGADDSVHGQRRFMADASHELRTPVPIARTTAQVTLARPGREEAEYRESLQIIAAQMRRLTRIVDDMFMLALADANGRPLAVRTVYLDEVANECGRAARVRGDERQIRVVVHVPREVPVRGDEGLLRRLLMNQLENAVRHTPDRGVVTPTLQPNGSHVKVAVEDTGPGIQEADRERIFDRFVRLAPAGSDGGAGLDRSSLESGMHRESREVREPGFLLDLPDLPVNSDGGLKRAAGIGRPIVRWIAERHGGTVQVDPAHTGSGRFVVVPPADASGGVCTQAASLDAGR